MGDLIEFKVRDESTDIEQTTGDVICLCCRHKWVGVCPVGQAWFECPKCGCLKGRRATMVNRVNEPKWECACGSDLFNVTPAGCYCIECGAWQQF